MIKYIDDIHANSHYFRKRIKDAFGIIGFVKFLKGYYLILITECKKIAKVGRHDIFTVKDTEMVRLYNYHVRDKNLREDEKKYKNIFKNFNLTKWFYFSYTYNLTIKFQELAMKKLKSHQANAEYTKNTITKREFESEIEGSEMNEYSSFNTNNHIFQNSDRLRVEGFHAEDYYPWNENFLWNYHLIKEFFSIITDK